VLPWTTNAPVYIDASQFSASQNPGSTVTLCNGGCWPYPEILNYLLRASGSGTYSVVLSGYSQSGATIGVWVDGNLLQTISLPQSEGNSTAISFNANAGFHTLSLCGGGSAQSKLLQWEAITITLTSGGGSAIAPSAPINLIVSGQGNANVTLIWDSQTTATNYLVQRSTTSGGPYTTVSQTSQTSYTDTNLQNNQMYYYVVISTNSAGQSGLSPQVQAIPYQQVIPAAPNVQGSGGLEHGNLPWAGLGQAYIYWDPVPNVLTYEIYRSTNPTTNFSQISTQLGTYFYDSALNPGTYYYNVLAMNIIGSNTAQIKIVVPSTSNPAQPTNLTVTQSSGIATLNWNPGLFSYPELGELFLVQRSTNQNGPWTSLENLSTANYIDCSATQNYCYQIIGTNGDGGQSAPSEVVCAN